MDLFRAVVEDPLHDDRRQTQGKFVDEKELGICHQRPGNRPGLSRRLMEIQPGGKGHAAMGVLAAGAMAFSSFSVVMNALRLKRVELE